MSFDANMIALMHQNFWSECENMGERLPEEFKDWLQKETDFFTAPASAGNHLNCEAGLLCHSLNVARRILKVAEMEEYGVLEGYDRDSLVLIALFHDLCKVGTYKESYRNQKQPDGTWKRVPCYKFQPDLPMGHGEKSVYLLLKHGVKLTDAEALAIRWHMSAWDKAVCGGDKDIAQAMGDNPLALALQMADQMATFWDERGM